MKYLPVIIGVLLGTVIASAQSVQVQLHYTGSGTVDATHKIYVALWDSPGFTGDGGGPPMDVKGTTSKDGVVTFTDIQKGTVYVSTAYDPSGTWDAQSGPPKGSSLGMYSKKPPTPEAINVAAGKTVKVTITFDDSAKAQ
ncbi:MAG: hypothetical protein M3O35_21240 [Acidobacteriota bacterium]|nr:hypothetical protein [Acidobacteriota bacterium]